MERLKWEQRGEKPPSDVVYNEETKEYERRIGFYGVPRYIRAAEARAVWEENNSFLFHEYYAYQQDFFDFLKGLVAKAWEMLGAAQADN